MASDSPDPAIAPDVRALVADLLPVLAPGASIDLAAGIVIFPVGGARARVSTDSLVAACSVLPQHAWPREVDSWLRSIGAQIATALAEREPFGRIDPLLRVRIVPPLSDDDKRALVCSPFGRYFDALVVIDHPDRGGPLTREFAARLALNDPGTHAIDNTIRRELPTYQVTDTEIAGGTPVRLLRRDDGGQVTAALLAPDRFLPPGSGFGALVGLPRFSSVVLLPALSRAVLDQGPAFAAFVAADHDAAVDRCDRRTYWWAEGNLVAVEVDRRGRLRVPAELRPLVAALPKDDRRRR